MIIFINTPSWENKDIILLIAIGLNFFVSLGCNYIHFEYGNVNKKKRRILPGRKILP
jgi:hypothetical protein